jgi:ATP-binding cassette subfamily B protein/ATP-binding cassette subfamily C protein/ATP-binding cassette subfamily B multidrug efflux pump
MTLTQTLARFMRQHWRSYGAAAVMLAGVALLTVWIPRQVGHIVDGLVAGSLQGRPLMLELGWLIAAGFAIYLLRVGWRLALFAAAYRLGQQLRSRLYARLSLQGPRYFQAKRTGDLMALATNDIDAIEMAAGDAMLAAFDGSLTLLLVLLMMTIGVDWRLGLAALVPFPLMALAFWKISDHIHLASQSSLSRFAGLNHHVQEGLSSVRTVRALGLIERNTQQFSTLAASAAEASYRAQRWEAAYEPAVGMTLSTAVAIALGLGGYLVAQQELTLGQLTAFTMYLGQLIWPMFAAGWVLSLFERGRAAWERLAPVLDAPLSLADTGAADMPAAAEIRFEHLRFSYPEAQRPAVDDVNLTLKPGQTLGLVGPTGSGKSTLIRLLLRQFEPDSGAITAAGIALPALRLEALRAAIAWVPQEPFLFSATIAENIALARPEASRAEIENAARLAAIDEEIARLPQGYDTEVGERGVTLSGGQRQRVAIARALLGQSAGPPQALPRPLGGQEPTGDVGVNSPDAPILLLDDALSAVDTGTETLILEHLRELRAARPERSVIIVSHRLSAVVDADHIAVLRGGRITEQGTHAELLDLGGWYAAQWRYQQLEASIDAL